jgi:aerobic carbon-monoxide dehydrogenase large subunit
MDYLLPTSMKYRSPELGETVTWSPHHPISVKGIGASAPGASVFPEREPVVIA